MSNKFTSRPAILPDKNVSARFHRFKLRDNPFPNEPFVNSRSKDSRINGKIYEASLRQEEHAKLQRAFVEPSRNDGSHLKLGYIEDASYLGRGNGKSAFILNATESINTAYCLDSSQGRNKCFSVIVNPMGGGKTKSFDSFVDLLMTSILESRIIDIAVGSLILDALNQSPDHQTLVRSIADEEQLIECVFSEKWYETNAIDRTLLSQSLSTNDFITELRPDTPLAQLANRTSLFNEFVTSDLISNYYGSLRKGQSRFELVFNELPLLFLAAGFNGGFIFVDDFERIPDFQSARQKRDFATELRTALFDGPYVSSAYGFYTALLVLHAGVPRLINDAWQASGINSRSPMNETGSPHVILFEKLESTKVETLLIRYLDAFRLPDAPSGDLWPFESAAVKLIAESCDYNAGRILQTANSMLDYAIELKVSSITVAFAKERLEANDNQDDQPTDLKTSLSNSLDLETKAGDEQ
jgi:hypothetical protein